MGSILKTKKEAVKAHKNVNFLKVALYSLGGLAVMAVGGYLAAPAIGAAIGSAAGLAGAAATAHGLAVLGGGSLALGGAGMAGGLYLVTGTAAALGSISMGGGSLLLQLGAASARLELMKLQVTYKELLLHNQLQSVKAQEAIKSLHQDKKEITERLKEERKLNDRNAERVKDLEETLEALENALEWMEENKAA